LIQILKGFLFFLVLANGRLLFDESEEVRESQLVLSKKTILVINSFLLPTDVLGIVKEQRNENLICLSVVSQ
jgi:hypothetical protein